MTKLLGLPFLASEHGAKVDHLILYMHWLMGVLFIGWMAYFVYVLIRFRKSRHPKASYQGRKRMRPLTSKARWPSWKGFC